MGGVGVNGSFANLNKTDSVTAYVGDVNTSVKALGQGSGFTVPTSNAGSFGTGTVSGLSVAATASESIGLYAAGAAVTGSYAGSGSVIVNQTAENTSALIGSGATINGSNSGAASAQTVNVLAADITNMTSGAGALVVNFGAAGIGVAADGASIKKTTTAGIDNGATVNAADAVNVGASSIEYLTSMVGAGGVSIGVGLFGTTGDYATAPISPTTTAYIGSCLTATGCAGGATVKAGQVSAQSKDSLTFSETTGVVSAALGALGAATFEVESDARTTAYIGAMSKVISSSGGIAVQAAAIDSLQGSALAGSGGAVAGDAAVASLTDNSTSAAFMADQSVVSSNGDLTVAASNNRTVSGTTSGLAVGLLAVGASVTTANMNGGSSAYIGAGSITSNTGAITVRSDTTDNLNGTSLVVAGAVLAGSAGVTTLSDSSSSAAYIGDQSTVTSYGDLTVAATNRRTVTGTTGSMTAGEIAGGAAYTEIDLTGGTTSFIGNAAVGSTAGALNVMANLTDYADASADGVGVGIGTGVGTHSKITDNANTSSYATGGAVLSSAGITTLDAEATRTLNAESGAVSVGGLTIGASLAEVSVGGLTQAYLGDGARVGSSTRAAGGLAVKAGETDSGTATATPLAGGVIAGDGGDATVSLTPYVRVSLTGANVNTSGAVLVDASGTATANSTVTGLQLGAFTAGSSNAQATIVPTISIGISGGQVQAGSINVDAEGNQNINVNSTSSASSSFVSGMGVHATATLAPTVTVTVGGDASLTASGGIAITANSQNTMAKVLADGSAGSFNVGTDGSADANATLTNTSNVTVGKATLTSTGGDLTVTASSDNSLGQPVLTLDSAGNLVSTGDAKAGISAYTYSGGGLLNMGGATTTVNVTDQVTTTLQGESNLQAPAGNLSVSSLGSDKVYAQSWNPNGFSAVATSDAKTYVTVVAEADTGVQASANLNGNQTKLTAELTNLDVQGYSNASARGALGVGSYATTDVAVSGAAALDISNGATVAGNQTLALNALIDGANTSLASSADTDSQAGFVPVSEAGSYNSPILNSSVRVNDGATLISDALTVNALKPDSSDPSSYNNQANASWTFYALFGIPISDTSHPAYGVPTFSNSIDLNGVLKQPPSIPALLIHADGTYSGAFGVLGKDANNMVLEGVSGKDLGPTIELNADHGTISGTLTVDPNVRVVNNSNLNVIVGDINAQGAGNGHLTIDPTPSSNTLTLNIGPMPITFENNTGSNVVFAGKITDPAGTLSVTNLGGNILGTQGSSIQVTAANLDAPEGAIGIGGNLPCAATGCPSANLQFAPLNLFLAPTLRTSGGTATLVAGQLSALARNDISLNLTPDATPVTTGGAPALTSVPLQVNQILAGGDIDLTLNPGVTLIASGGTAMATQVDAAYSIPAGDWVGAGGTVHAGFNGVTGATPTLIIDGSLTSGFERLQFTANADGSLSSMVSAATASSSSLINYAQSVGSSLQLSNIDASRSGITLTGTGNIAGGGTLGVLNGASDISIVNHSALPLTANQIINTGASGTVDIALNGTVSLTPITYGSPTGRIALTSDTSSIQLQQLLNNPNGTVTLNTGADISGPGGVSLIRATDIGLTAGGSIGPDLGIEMTTPLGLLRAEAGGPIGLRSITGDMAVGTVDSTTGSVTLNSNQGSILNGDGRTTANISAVASVNLGAPNGSIGAANAPLNIDGTVLGTMLNARAGQDVTVSAVGGNMNVGYVSARGDATLSATGSILDADQRTTSNVDANNINLAAATGNIGTSSVPLNIDAGPTGSLQAAAARDIYINQLSGPLHVKQVASTAGNIGLTSIAGDIGFGQVTARAGDVVITASGSIVNSSPAIEPNVSGRNLTLDAIGGGIGSTSAPLVIQASGLLNAMAASDIALRQIGGDLHAQDLISQNGSLSLVVENGNAYLHFVSAPHNVLLVVNGNLLDLGLINPADSIKIDLTGSGGVLTIGQMYVGTGSVDITADLAHILRIVHTAHSNPIFFDLTTTEYGYNLRPLDPGILLGNNIGTLEWRQQPWSAPNLFTSAGNTVIDMTNDAANSGAARR